MSDAEKTPDAFVKPASTQKAKNCVRVLNDVALNDVLRARIDQCIEAMLLDHSLQLHQWEMNVNGLFLKFFIFQDSWFFNLASLHDILQNIIYKRLHALAIQYGIGLTSPVWLHFTMNGWKVMISIYDIQGFGVCTLLIPRTKSDTQNGQKGRQCVLFDSVRGRKFVSDYQSPNGTFVICVLISIKCDPFPLPTCNISETNDIFNE